MTPWYRGFHGSVVLNEEGSSYLITGNYQVIGSDTLIISELPLRKWTRDYKTALEHMAQVEDPAIDDIKEFHKDNSVHFRLKIPSLRTIDDIPKKFNLTSNLSCRNYVLFDSQGRIRKYSNEVEIMEEYYPIRLMMYSKRKAHMLSTLRK